MQAQADVPKDLEVTRLVRNDSGWFEMFRFGLKCFSLVVFIVKWFRKNKHEKA